MLRDNECHMPRLLFIDLDYHLKTSSSRFMQEFLSSEFDIEYHCENAHGFFENGRRIPSLRRKNYDVLVYWQVTGSMKYLVPKINVRCKIFFPMYDELQDLLADKEEVHAYLGNLVDFKIICFCKAAYEQFKRLGFDAYYFQFYCNPQAGLSYGNVSSLFFWKRNNDVTVETVVKIVNKLSISHIHWHDVPDPGCNSDFDSLPDNVRQMTTSSEWFPNKLDMINVMNQSALFLAPRAKEGIGMSFLDAMAHGRCVIAIDSPTVNEYIKDGWNGILYRRGTEFPYYSEENIRKMQHNALMSIKNGYGNWLACKSSLLQLLNSSARDSIPEDRRQKYVASARRRNFRIKIQHLKMFLAHFIKVYFITILKKR